MSLWFPRTYTQSAPGFSSLFRMLDDFEKYAQSHVTGSQLGNSMTTTTPSIMGGGGGGMQTVIAPKFDVTEHEKEYSLQGELPGVPPENVVVEFTDPQTMVIRGHAEREHTEGDPSLARLGAGEEKKKIEAAGGDAKMMKQQQEEGKEGKEMSQDKKGGKAEPKYWLSERSFGEFSRVFNFPSSVDQDKVEAKFDHGVLNITVPKMEKGTRKIDIK